MVSNLVDQSNNGMLLTFLSNLFQSVWVLPM